MKLSRFIFGALFLMVPLHATRADTIVLSGAIECEDNMLTSISSQSNSGASAVLNVGTDELGQNPFRSIYRFDFSSLANTTITSASLQLTLGQTSPAAFSNQTVYLYRITAANAGWQQGGGDGFQQPESCWDNISLADGTPWAGSAGLSTAGIDYVSTPVGSFTCSSTDAKGTTYMINFTDTSFIAGWSSDPSTNAGFLLSSAGLEAIPGANIGFYSSDTEFSSDMPALTLVTIPEPSAGVLLLTSLVLFKRSCRRKVAARRL